MFLFPWFAVAGLILAAGPILIHLLNRQRFRVVEWAAMEFLRQAMRRSRRMVRLQNLLLLVVRVVCVVLFGLAMARPCFVRSGTPAPPNQPVHAVLLVDNSLSMCYEQLGRTVLDEAKSRARDWIDRLPAGSRVSVIPLCSPDPEMHLGAYGTKEDAREAVAAIEPVDEAASVQVAFELARQACQRTPSPSNKQIVLLSDQQASNWPTAAWEPNGKGLGGPVQIVELAPKAPENAWVAGLRLQDGLADLEDPAVFLATIQYEGATPRRDVPVTLLVDGAPFATQRVDLEPGQVREVRFPPYRFDVSVATGQAVFVPVEVALPEDRLPADDHRMLLVPVVAGLPVVMVDQWGSEESAERNRFGETRRLRQLLAPVTGRKERPSQGIRMRHVRFEQIDRTLLADARLVVIAGVARPQPTASLTVLREYVEQGGSVILAAGADFDPAAWTAAAWQDGLGILPAPLKPDPIGLLPSQATRPIEPFQLDVTSLDHDYFVLEQCSRAELDELWRRPLFFKAVEADVSPDAIGRMMQTLAAHWQHEHQTPKALDERLQQRSDQQANGSEGEAGRGERPRVEQARDRLRPRWLVWTATAGQAADDSPNLAERTERARPRVLARFTNQAPFLIERSIGSGRVLMITTGLFREWNTLTGTDAVVLLDRMVRDLLEKTLPRRNLTPTEKIVLPIPAELRSATFTLQNPAGRTEPVRVEALSKDRHGLVLGRFGQRGIWRVKAQPVEPSGTPGDPKLMETLLAVNGPSEESRLQYLDESAVRERMPQMAFHWVGAGEAIQLGTGTLAAEGLWRWLMGAFLLGLVVESLLLARPVAQQKPNGTQTARKALAEGL